MLSPNWQDRGSIGSVLAHEWVQHDPERLRNKKIVSKEVLDNLRKYQNGRRFIRALMLGILLDLNDEEQESEDGVTYDKEN